MLCVWACIDPLIICYVCGPHTHIIRDNKSFNPRVNAWLTLLLYECVANTHEPNPFGWGKDAPGPTLWCRSGHRGWLTPVGVVLLSCPPVSTLLADCTKMRVDTHVRLLLWCLYFSLSGHGMLFLCSCFVNCLLIKYKDFFTCEFIKKKLLDARVNGI